MTTEKMMLADELEDLARARYKQEHLCFADGGIESDEPLEEYAEWRAAAALRAPDAAETCRCVYPEMRCIKCEGAPEAGTAKPVLRSREPRPFVIEDDAGIAELSEDTICRQRSEWPE